MGWNLDGAGAAKGTPVGPNVVPAYAGSNYWARINPDPWTVPNNYAEYSVYRLDGVGVPSNAQMCMVTARTTARAAYNSAGTWRLYVQMRTPAGAWTAWEVIDYTLCHNYGDQHASFNTTLQGWVNTPPGTYNLMNVYVNASSDGAGAPWSLHAGSIRVDWVGE